MTVLHLLATALNRRDETPNCELARTIVGTKDVGAVKELVENLSNKDKGLQADCIKVLYEIGASEPALIASYYREFGKLLESNNNRLVWGAMTALDSIALKEPKGVYSLLPRIVDIAETGSVISRDHAVGILTKLGTLKQYTDKCVSLLLKQLVACPGNQFPMYAEMCEQVVTDKNRKALERVIADRLQRLEKESQKKRIMKVLKRIARPST